jgi:DNA polymerase-1
MVDEKTHVLKLEKNGFTILDKEAVKDAKGVWPTQIRDYLALLGDSSDNVPGVKGIGEKTACKLLEEFGSLEGIYAHLAQVKPKLLQTRLHAGEASAHLSYDLVKLELGLDLIQSWEELKCSCPALGAQKHFVHHNASALIKTLKELSPEALPLFSAHAEKDPLPFERESSHTRGHYHPITQREQVKTLLAEALKAPYLVLDTETTGLNTMNTELLGIALSFKTGEGYYLPLRTADGDHLEKEALTADFNAFFAQNPKIIGHNLKFDWEVFLAHGFIPPVAYADTMLMAWLLDSTSTYKMDFLALKYLDNYVTIAFSDLVAKGSDFSSVPLAQATEYSAEDADITLRLFETLEPLLKEKGLTSLLFDLEMPLMEILTQMERKGICVDPARLEETRHLIEGKRQALEKEIFKDAGEEFNILSSQQTQAVLLKLNLMEDKGKKDLSTSSTNLKKISSDHPILERIIQYRSYKKLINSYLNTLPSLIEPSTGRIHTSFFQPGTETGRISSLKPNLQNIPIRDEEGKAIREAFVAPEGHELISADYSQIELAVLAHLSEDPTLCESFRQGDDIHTQTAMRLFKTDSVTPEQRRIAKTINFGVLYKMSPFRLSNELKIDFKEAKSFIDNYFETYKEIKSFFEKQIKFVEEHGYSQTILGHRRPLRGIYSGSHLERAEAERAAINSVIQGSAADIVKMAMIKTFNALKVAGEPAFMLLQVHDELLFEAPSDKVKEACAIIQREMENALTLIIPLKVHIKVGKSWGTMQEF